MAATDPGPGDTVCPVKTVLWILVLVVGAFFALALMGYFRSRAVVGSSAKAAAERMPAIERGDMESAAAFVDGDISQMGLLRLTGTTLIFMAGNPDGPDIEIGRPSISQAEVTRVLPDGRALSKPFLLVTSRGRGGTSERDAFLLTEPQVWVDRLLG